MNTRRWQPAVRTKLHYHFTIFSVSMPLPFREARQRRDIVGAKHSVTMFFDIQLHYPNASPLQRGRGAVQQKKGARLATHSPPRRAGARQTPNRFHRYPVGMHVKGSERFQENSRSKDLG